MRFESRSGERIGSREDWIRLAPPAAKVHEKEGRSAIELGGAWMTGADRDAAALLSTHPDLGQVSFEQGIVEKQTRFDSVPRGPRNHDLLVMGTAGSRRLVVGVEGKADETFGQTLMQYRDAKRSPNSRAHERLDLLTRTFFDTTLEERPGLGALRYQLCSALAGTLADAKEQAAELAVLLVHELRTDLTDDDKHASNARDLDAFLDALPGNPSGAQGEHGWVAGPWLVRGRDKRLPDHLPVYVAKLVSDIRSTPDGD